MVETLRDTLARLQEDLESKISELRKQLAPLERELAEVKRVRNTIVHGEVMETMFDNPHRGMTVSFDDAYKNLTMKELVRMALHEQFREGATAKELLEFFHNAWHREDITRESLSPQLSRLRAEGVLGRSQKRWYLIDEPPVHLRKLVSSS